MCIPQNLLSHTEESNKGSTTEEKSPEVIEKTSITLPEAGCLGTAELVFPLKSIPSVVAGLCKTYLPFVALRPFPNINANFLHVP